MHVNAPSRTELAGTGITPGAGPSYDSGSKMVGHNSTYPTVYSAIQAFANANLPAATVSSMAALRLVSGAEDGQTIALSGYLSENDGGGGIFVWNSTSTTADNGGTIITPTGQAVGRWYRIYSGGVSVKWFGAAGNGVTDDTTAIQNAIAVLNTTGGEVYIPPGKYLISSTLNIGNGTNASGNAGWSTYGAIILKGLGAAPGVGPFDPVGGSSIISSVAGPAISVNGPLAGWGIENLFIQFTTTSTSSIGIKLVEAQQGAMRNIAIVNCYGIGIELTTYGNNNCTLNRLENLFVYMGSSLATATAVQLTGVSGANTSFNTFDGLHIQPSASGQTGIWLQYCDSNIFLRVDINPFGTSQGIRFDYSVNSTYPTGNQFYLLEMYNNSMSAIGSPSTSSAASPNIVYGFSQVNGNSFPILNGIVAVEKIKLNGNLTLYVSPSGSDTNSGLTSAGPLLTIQHAYNLLVNNYDLGGMTATIQLADGTYTSGLTASGNIGSGSIVINGNATTPSNVNVTASGFGFISKFGANITVQNLELSGQATASLYTTNGGIINFSNVVFGTCTGASHIWAAYEGIINATGNYSITGAASQHLYATNGGLLSVDSVTVTITGTPAISTFAFITMVSALEAIGVTFTGGTTGTRYFCTMNGAINTNGGGINYFPGSVAGTTASGGQYA